MTSLFQNSSPPYPCWKRRLYHLSRPVTEEDVRAFLGNEELYVRETQAGPVNIIHKYGLIEIHCITGKAEVEVWFNCENGAYPSEYLDALFSTRFD
jgi:hypothetical protein